MKRKLKEETESVDVVDKVKKIESISDVVKSIRDRLHEDENEITALKEFLKRSRNKETGDTFVKEYISVSPEVKEGFHLFSSTGKPSHDKLELIWQMFDIILNIITNDETNKGLGLFIASKIIQNHSKLIHTSLSKSASNKLLQSVLKCLTLVIAQGPSCIKEFLASFDFSMNGFKIASTKRDSKMKPDPRTCFIRFSLAFFVFGDKSIINQILEEKGLSMLVFNGLHLDSQETKIIILDTLFKKVVCDETILRKTKLQFFGPFILAKVAPLIDHKLEDVSLISKRFLDTLCTSSEYGICFKESNGNFTGKLINPILLKFLQTIKQQVIQSATCLDLAIKIFKKCPDVIVPFINNLQLQFDPQNETRFSKNITFLKQVYKELPSVLDFATQKTPSDILMKILIPIQKNQLALGLKAKSEQQRQHSLDLLIAILNRCRELVASFQDEKTSLVPTSLQDSFIRSLMQNLTDVTILVTIRQNSLTNDSHKNKENNVKDESVTKSDVSGLKTLLELSTECLQLYQIIKPGVITESGFNICKLLISSESLSHDVLHKNLLILLDEPNEQVASWLDKKISGTSSVLHLLIQMMNNHKDSDDIINICSKLYTKILNPTRLLDDHESMIILTINKFADTIREVRCSNEILGEFATASIKMLKDPFEYMIYMDDSSSIFANPLLMSLKKNMSSQNSIKLFIIPLLRLILLSQINPEPYSKLIEKEIGNNPVYTEFLKFVSLLKKCFQDSTKRKHGQSELSKLLGTSREDQLLLLFLPFSTTSSDEVKILENILSKSNNIVTYFNNHQILSVEKFTFFMNLTNILFHSTKDMHDVSTLSKIMEIMNNIAENYVSTSPIHASLIFKFNFISEVLFHNNVVWHSFVTQLAKQALKFDVIQNSEEWQMFLKSTISKLVQNDVKCVEEREQEIIFKFFQSILSQFNKNSQVLIYIELLNILSHYEPSNSKNWNTLIANIADILKVLYSNIEKYIGTFNYTKLLKLAIKTNNKDLASVCHSILCVIGSTEDFDEVISLPFKTFKQLMCQESKEIISLATLVLRRTSNIRDSLIREVCAGKYTKQPEVLTPFISTLLLYASHKDTDELGGTLKTIYMESIANKKNIKWPLELLLPYLNDDDINKISNYLSKSLDLSEVMSLLHHHMSAIQLEENNENIKINLFNSICISILSLNKLKLKSDKCEDYLKLLCTAISYCIDNDFKLENEHQSILKSGFKTFAKYLLLKHFKLKESFVLLHKMILFLKQSDAEDCFVILKHVYAMISSHSEFFDIMLEKNSLQLKGALCEVLLEICTIESSCCDQSFIQVLSASFHATLSQADRAILKLLKLHESNGFHLEKPFYWGDAALEKLNNTKSDDQQNLVEQPYTDLLNSFDSKMILKTAFEMPNCLQGIENGDRFYDPAFVLPLLLTKLQPGCVFDVRNFITDGFLSLTISCLSCHEIDVRQMVYTALALFNEHLENSRFKEKNQMVYLLMLMKNSVSEEFQRWPSLWSMFIIRYIYIVMKPEHSMYNTLNRLILQKPVMHMREFPIFLPLFNSSSLQHVTERHWLMKLLVYSMKDASDYYMYKRLHVFELIMAYYQSPQADKSMKELIIRVLTLACGIPVAAYDLTKTHALLSWLHSCIVQTKSNQRSLYFDILSALKKAFSSGHVVDHRENSERLPIPRMLVYEMHLICSSQLSVFSDLPKQMQIQLCDILIWLYNLPGYYGDMKACKIQDDSFVIVSRLQDLYLEGNEKDEEFYSTISNVFASALKVHLYQDSSECSLKSHPRIIEWRRVFMKASEQKHQSLLELFSNKFMKTLDNRYMKIVIQEAFVTS